MAAVSGLWTAAYSLLLEPVPIPWPSILVRSASRAVRIINEVQEWQRTSADADDAANEAIPRGQSGPDLWLCGGSSIFIQSEHVK